MDSEPINPTEETNQTAAPTITGPAAEPTAKPTTESAAQPAKKPTSNGFAIASFILTLIPILLIAYVSAASGGEDESGKGAIGWLIIAYYCTAGIPVFIMSIIFAVIGLKSKLRSLAIASLVIKFTAPITIFIFDMLFEVLLG